MNNKNSLRIYEIDILRFIAAVFVFFFHAAFRGYYFNIYSIEFPILAPLSKYGFLGVDLFFIISGFVIFMSALGKSPVDFVVSRVVRLYPAFWICVSATALVCLLWGPDIFKPNLAQYLVNLSMLSGFVGVKSIDGVYWTLFLEIIFYALIFVLIVFKKLDNIILCSAVWLSISFIACISNFQNKFLNFIFLLQWSQYFVSGIMFYLIRKNGPKLNTLLLLFAAYILALLNLPARLEAVENSFDVSYSIYVAASIVTLFYIIMSIIAFNLVNIKSHIKLITTLGALSYPVYLIHHNIGFVFIMRLENYINKYALITSLFILTLVMAYIVTIFEKKTSKLLRNSIKSIITKITNTAYAK